MCDYYYQATGNRVLRVGGYFGNSSRAGLWYFYANYSSSNAYFDIGARLLKY
jgi:hypothetical protein